MGEFLALLLSYYTCDAAAQAQEPLSGDRLACVETYEEVKAFFFPLGDPPADPAAQAAQRIAAYRAFSDWEAANADTVADLRQTAVRLADAE